MDLLLTDDHRMIQRAAREFAAREIVPRAARMDQDERMDDALRARLAEMGYFGFSIPPEFGGVFTDYLTATLISMEIGRGCAATATFLGASAGLFGGNLAAHGTQDQKARYLPTIATGERLGCLAMTEPGAGSDVFSLSTRAVRKGEVYVLNGTKTFISNGPIADLALVYATLDPKRGKQGIGLFIVEKEFKGYTAGRTFEKMGLRASPTGEIVLEDCEVPEENLVGMAEGLGFQQMVTGLNVERVLWSAIAVGIAQAAFKSALEYAFEREQFGKPIFRFQLVQDMLARASTDLTLGEQTCLLAAHRLDQGGAGMALAAARCKLFCTEMVNRVTSDALQVHGGYGYMRDFPLERYVRDARVFAIGAGTNEIQKLLIAQQLEAMRK